MSKTLSEEKILKRLNIPDFRHMSKDKMMEFASSIHEMDPEVAKAAIAQFPNFKELATDSIKDGLNVIKEMVNNDKEEQVKIYESLALEQNAYLEILKCDDLSFDEKLVIMNQLESIRNVIIELNQESKSFKLKMTFLSMISIATTLFAAAALLGGSTKAETDSESQD